MYLGAKLLLVRILLVVIAFGVFHGMRKILASRGKSGSFVQLISLVAGLAAYLLAYFIVYFAMSA